MEPAVDNTTAISSPDFGGWRLDITDAGVFTVSDGVADPAVAEDIEQTEFHWLMANQINAAVTALVDAVHAHNVSDYERLQGSQYAIELFDPDRYADEDAESQSVEETDRCAMYAGRI